MLVNCPSFVLRQSSRLLSVWHMLVGAGAAFVDTVPSVCSPMWCSVWEHTEKAVPVWREDGFRYQLAAERGRRDGDWVRK